MRMGRKQVLQAAMQSVGRLAVGLLILTPSKGTAEDWKSVAARLEAARTAAELDGITRGVEADRRELTAELVDLLRGPSSDAVKARACYLVGVFGDLSASGALVDNIAVAFYNPRMMMIPLFDWFPCEEALDKLGGGAQDDLVAALGKTDDACKRALELIALADFRGPDGATAILQRALAGKRGSDASRLEAALKSMEQWADRGHTDELDLHSVCKAKMARAREEQKPRS